MSKYQLKEIALTASGNVNPALESQSDEDRKSGKKPVQAHDDKGRLLYKVGYLENVTSRSGNTRAQEHFVKVPRGDWYGKLMLGTQMRFVNFMLSTGTLSDGGFYESLKADDIVIGGSSESNNSSSSATNSFDSDSDTLEIEE